MNIEIDCEINVKSKNSSIFYDECTLHRHLVDAVRVGLAVRADVVVPGGVGTLVNVGAALHRGHVTHFTLVTLDT